MFRVSGLLRDRIARGGNLKIKSTVASRVIRQAD
jgi:hypothetical protein